MAEDFDLKVGGFDGYEARSERLTRLTQNPSIADRICGFIAEGGDLQDLADGWNVSYGALSNWMNADADRRKRYENAHKDAEGWLVQRVKKELKALSFSNVQDLYDDAGNLLEPHAWPEHAARAVGGIKVKELFDNEGVKEGELKEIKMIDKTKSLDLLGKTVAMFINKVEHSADKSLEDLLADVRKLETKSDE